MTKRKVYFDSCIFISYLHKKHKNHQDTFNSLKAIKEFETMEAYSSEWAINEMIKVLVKGYHYSKKKAESIAEKIFKESSIGGIEIKWANPDSNSKYTFKEFFKHITSQLMEIKSIHLADAIHSVIMINNNIDCIFTTNGDDFRGLKTFTVLEPKQIIVFAGN
jgi:predicted nucleic acid-binding protein